MPYDCKLVAFNVKNDFKRIFGDLVTSVQPLTSVPSRTSDVPHCFYYINIPTFTTFFRLSFLTYVSSKIRNTYTCVDLICKGGVDRAAKYNFTSVAFPAFHAFKLHKKMNFNTSCLLHIAALLLVAVTTVCVFTTRTSASTTEEPCVDVWSNCETRRDENIALGKDFCNWVKPKENCKRTCQICGTAPSTCSNAWRPFLCEVRAARALINKNKTKEVFCSWKNPKENCKAFCGLCDDEQVSLRRERC